MRRSLRILLWLAAFLMVAAAAVMAVLETPWGRELIRRKAEQALAEKFPGSRIGSVEGNVFGTLELGDVEIGGADGHPVAHIGELDVDVELVPLLGKRVRVDRLALEDVAISVRAPAKPTTEEPEDNSPSWTIDLRDVTVRRISVAMPDGRVEVSEASLAAAVRVPAHGPMTAALRVHGTWRGREGAALAFVRRNGDVLEVPFATAWLDGGRDDATALAIGMSAPVNRLPPPTALLAGAAAVHAPAALARDLAGIELPADLSASVAARGGDHVDVRVAAGAASVYASLAVEVAARRARGLVIAAVPDATALTRGKLAGRATAVGALEVDPEHVRGLVSVKGERDGYHAFALVAVDAERTRGWTLAQLASDFGPTHATVAATFTRAGNAITLSEGSITGRAVHAKFGRDARAWYVDANLTGAGRVWPDPDVRGDGKLELEGAEAAQIGADVLHVALSNVHATSEGADGRVRVQFAGMQNDGRPLGSGELAARFGVGTKGTLDLQLDSHRVVTASGATWAGAGGRVAIDPVSIVVTDVHTASGAGRVTANAHVDRASGDLKASLVANGVALASLAPGLAGSIDAKGNVTRHAGRWDATANLDGHAVATAPTLPPLDAHGTLALHGSELAVDVTTSAPSLGAVRVRADVAGPRDVTDALAWRRLDRRAIRSLALDLDDVKLPVAAPSLTGAIAGTAELTRDGATGQLHVRGVHTPAGDAELDVTLDGGERGGVAATLAGRVPGLVTADGTATLELPAHPFDPAAWAALGRNALAGAHVEAKAVAFDPGVLARFGVTAPYHGTLDAAADIAPGATTVTAHAAVHGLQGGPLVKPLELAFDATSGAAGIDAKGGVQSGSLPVLAFDAHLDKVLDPEHLAALRTAALTGTVALPALPALPDAGAKPAAISARELLAIVGRDDVTDGKLTGTIKLGGTVIAPIALATFTASDLTIRASVEGRAPARVSLLEMSAQWANDTGLVFDATAHGGRDSMLRITAHGRPDRPTSLAGTVFAQHFDIAPLTAFAPGALGAARGVLDASLALEGFDPDTGKLSGKLHLLQARVPLDDRVGTLRNGDLTIEIKDHRVSTKLTGKLGRGDVVGSADIELVGSTPHKIDAQLGLRSISLIRAFQPVIDADVTAHLNYDRRWTGNVAISNGHVVVPSRAGHALLESTTPTDMVFVDAPPPKASPLLHRPAPLHPWLITDVTIGDTKIDVQDEEYQVSGRASGKIRVAIGGESIGVDGQISARRGEFELLGQRSELEKGNVIFDGTIDPLLEVRVVRDLGSMSVAAEVSGRASKPDVTFSSDTGSYSQGDLAGFFVGGQPGGDRSEAGQAATAAGTGYLSKKVTQRINKLLPIKLDLGLRYDASTAENSEALGLTKRINEDTYVEVRQHLEPRPDENPNDAVLEYRVYGDWLFRGSLGWGNATDGAGEIQHRWHW